MKLLVKTRGPYSLVDPYSLQMIRKNGWTVVSLTPFIEQQRGYQIETVAELPNAATDDEWLEYVKASDGDLDLAKASYMSKFEGKSDEPAAPVSPATEAPPAKRPYNRRKDV